MFTLGQGEVDLVLFFGFQTSKIVQVFNVIKSLNFVHLPNFIGNIFVKDFNLNFIVENPELRESLKTTWGQKLKIIHQNFEEVIFRYVEQSSTSHIFGGDGNFGEEGIFDIVKCVQNSQESQFEKQFYFDG